MTKFPFLYNPPNGTPPEAASVSFVKFNEPDTCDKTTYELLVIEPSTLMLLFNINNIEINH